MFILAALALVTAALVGVETLRPRKRETRSIDRILDHRADAELARMVEEWHAARAARDM